MPGTDPATRAKFINGLRDLAVFLDTNPTFPAPGYITTLHVFPEGQTDADRRSAVDQLAAILGTTAHDKNGHYAADTLFGTLTYRVITISDAARAEHRARTSYADCIQLDDTDDLGAAA